MKIAYITTSFGSLSHTFIRREVIELRNLGMDISLFGIHPDRAKELSEEDKVLERETIYLYPLKIRAIIAANAFFIANSPIKYSKTLLDAILNEEINPFRHLKLIYHFFVSPYIAMKMQRKDVRHIHAHFLNVPATIAMYCSKLLGISFSITVHSAGENGLKTMIGLRAKLREVKFICAISNYNKEYISKSIYPSREKTYVVRCGIDASAYRWKENQDITGKVKLISIGRFVEKKGFKYLLEGARLLKKENVVFKLCMIGDGPLKPGLKKLARDYDLNEEVVFKGAVSHENVKAELGKSDILIVPSVESKTGEKEGIPVVIMEAMASGLLIIATEHAGIPEIVKNKVTGILIPEKDPPAIIEAIKLATGNNTLVKNCIANAQKLVSKEFNIKTTGRIEKKIFEKNI